MRIHLLTEKCELIDLVMRHISSQHRTGPTTTTQQGQQQQQPTSSSWTHHNAAHNARHHPPPPPDDGIRVRASGGGGNRGSASSIRVRAMDSIRVRPGGSPPTSPNNDSGIRVFASQDEGRRSSGTSSQDTSSLSPTSPTCPHCPSTDPLSTSCCSLDTCPNSYPHSCPNTAQDHSADTSSQSSADWVLLPDLNAHPELLFTDNAQVNQPSSSIPLPPPTIPLPPPGVDGASEEQQQLNDDQLPMPPPPLLSSSSSSASSSAPTSAFSSPEPNKGILAGIVALDDLKSEEEIHGLSVRQCKELLSLHRVNYSGVREKCELLNKVKILWDDHRNHKQDVENIPDDMMCKICMDGVIDCVLLECGHMVSCTKCGKQMSECPLCRQYVVRVVRTFRA